LVVQNKGVIFPSNNLRDDHSSLGLYFYLFGCSNCWVHYKDLGPLTQRREFSVETKSATFLRNALQNALRCQICQGLIYSESISIDHIKRKEDGGTGQIENAQLTHPYCNTTVKN